jgi:hypothetical protein
MTSLTPQANHVVMPAPLTGQAMAGRMAPMSPSLRMTGLAGAASCVGLAAMMFGAFPVAGQPSVQQVTSDTPEYCLQLLDRVSELVRVADTPPPQEVTSLSSEGQKMCDQGQTRGGILRLRRALLLMTRQNGQP